MNRHFYRVVFNKARQMLMVVADIARSHTAGQTRGGMSGSTSLIARVSLTPLVLGISLALGLVSPAVQARIVADNHAPGTQQPTVISAANGVAQVNIQTPNSDGVSRNQYSQFDVEQRGAILNNSGVNTQTELGGLITGNPWLAQGEAQIILNEVNSRDPSQLNGFIEVAGKRADVIIANPAGITCHGCGFINARQTTLAAGQTILENGRLKGFEVGNGILTVDGKGLNDTQSDYTRLIARAVNINAKLHARDLTVTTGRNHVDAQGNVVQVHEGDNQNKPAFSLDVAAIGGMYANKIKLVGTEQGVGVRNAGQLGAQAGNLTLNNNGQLSNRGTITASADVDLQNQGNLINQGEMTAGQDMKIRARDHLDNQGQVRSGRHLDIRSASLGNQENGVLAAGIDRDGKLAPTGNLTLHSGGNVANRGRITAVDNMDIDNQGDVTTQGQIIAGGELVITSQGAIDNQGQVRAGQDHQGSLSLKNNGKVSNSGMLSGQVNVSVQNQGSLTNQGEMTAGQDLKIRARDHLDNHGRVRSGRQLDIRSASLDNQEKGELAAGIDRNGKPAPTGDFILHSEGHITNRGLITAADKMKIDNQGNLTNQGEMTAGQDLKIGARDHLDNGGRIRSGGDLDIRIASLDNQKNGVLAAGRDRDGKPAQKGDFTLRSEGNVTSHGRITAVGKVFIDNQGNFTHQGEMIAGQDMKIRARDHLDNGGRIRSGSHLDIRSASLGNQKNGELAAGVDYDGKLTSQGDFILHSKGNVTSHGRIVAVDNVDIDNQGNFIHQGEVTAGQDMNIRTRDHLDNQGRIKAGQHLDIRSATLANHETGVLAAGIDHDGKPTQTGDFTLNSEGNITNRGLITAADNLKLDNQGNLTNLGEMTTGQDMNIHARDHLDNHGRIKAGQHLDIRSASLDNQENGELAAGVDREGKLTQRGNFTLNSQGHLSNQGIIAASDNVTLENQRNFHHQGKIMAGLDATLKTRDQVTHQGQILTGRHFSSQSNTFHSQAGSILAAGVDRDGKPTQTGNLTVNARETASLHGHHLASDTLSVEAKNLSLRGSQTEGNDLTLTSATRLNLQDAYLSANKAMTLSAPEWIDNQRGELNAETLVLNSQQLLNNAGRITQTGQHSLRLEHAAGIENNGGTIASSGQDLILKAKTVANQKGTLAHAGTGVFSVDTADFQGKEGRLISDGELELSGGRYQLSRGRVSAQRITADIQSLDHRLGNMIQSGKNPLTLAIQQGLDNRSGTISANGTVDIRADNLANNILTDTELGKDDVLTKAELSHAQGNIVAAEDGRLQINVKNDVNNEAGQLRASDSVTISASSIHNQQGHISSSGGDITLTTGQLNNAAGHVTGAQNLRLTTAAINNEKGQIKAGDVDVNTGNHQLNNIAGQVAAERRMTLQTGELLNQGGLLQSGQALTLNTNGQHLDNRNTHLSGGVFSQGAMNLTVGRLSNQSGHIGSGAELTLTGDTVTNQQGQILGGKNTVLTVAALNNNQGLLQSGGQLTLNAQSVLNRNSGLQQGITSKQAMILNTQMLDNAQGVMVSADRLHIKTAQMNNRQGIMKAQTTLNLVSQGLDNRSGRIESEQAMFIDTQGKTLSNVEGKLNSQGRLTVRSGDLDNRRGVLHGQSGIEVGVNQLDNRENGKLLSEADLKLEADNVWNQQGQIVALNHLTMTVNATPTSPDEITFNNRAGLLRSGGNIDLSAHHINNADTRQPDQGMEGRTLTLRGNTLNNTQGQLVATENADLTLQSALNNHQGQMQANQILKARGKALAVINTQGDIKAGQGLVVEADALSGDGKLRSLGDITLNLLKDFIHTGELIANGQLTLTSQGDITNRNTISAATLLGHAVNLTNDATGKIWGQHQQWTVQNTVNNRGLIDGAQTYLKAAQLTNQGTGRLYGDHIALDARKLDNLAEKGKSAVIAARHRLDMGADELNNTTHSLIYSEGDVSIGGQLDSQYRATGKGQVLNNHSANIEAVGNMRLGMEKINNVNDHFSTEMQLISQEPVKEYQVGGTRYPVKDHKITIDNDEVDHACVDDMPCRDNFQVYQYTRTIEESRVKETDPAKMLAGKDLVIETTVLTNDKSQVVAGGGLTVTGGKIDNIDVQGERHVTDKGQIEYFWRIQKKGRDNQGWRSERYEPNPEIHAITLTPGTVEAQQGKVELKGQRPEAYQGEQAHLDAITGSPVNARFANEEVMVSDAVLRAPQRLDIVSAEPTAVGEKPVVIRTEAPHYRLPDNSLFKVNLPLNNTLLTPSPTTEKISGELAQDRPTAPDNPVVPLPEHRGNPFVVPEPDNQVLVETDPQFTQLKKWLGTDYMQQALQTDHNQLHKRLGDGFYEQHLLREQIVNLTGRRYLPGYRNDEEQFKALMNAGLRAQKTFNLVPGIALSAEQMARLTEDMVWLVNTPVTLSDGRQQTVWVPQVYVRTQGGTLDGTGALLSGNQVNLQLSGDLLNQGKIVGQDLSLLADNIRNQSGHMQGDNLSLLARTDLVQRGGALRADKSLTMQAGNHVDIASTTRSGENQAGSGRFSSTYVDNVAGIYVQGDDGKLHLQAGNDIHLSAAHLVTQGKRSEIQLDAGRDIQFGTAKTTRYEHTEAGRDHRVTQTTADEVGAVVQGAGQIKMQAGRDVQLRAAEVTAGDNLHLGAGRDVTVSAGEQQQTHDEYHKVKGSNSLVSSKTTTTRFQYDRQQARSSTLSGDAVKVEAGNDITVGGSNVVGTQAVTLNAGHNLNITTAREKNHEFYHQEEKKSGLMGTGGIGFTVGSSALKQSTDRDAVQYKGSTVGSSDGSVSLSANHQASVHGSDVVAGKDLDIQGKDVLISAAKNTHTELSKTEQKQSGLTLALSGAVGSALNTAVQTANDAKDTQDSRLKALKGTQAALSGVQGYQAYQLSEANAAKADAINQAGGEAKKPDDTIGIQLSYGSQSSKSDTRVDTTDSQGSHLNAGRDIRITATGDPAEENGGHLHIQGSGLKAGRDVALDAKQDIVLESAENTQTTRGKNSSQGGSVGVGLTAGQGGYGIKFSASVNKGKGHETGDGVTHTETLIDAGHQVSLKSGQDTTLKGAQVSGEKVTAEVGRNLHLQSEQDKDNFEAKQENISAGASFTYGSMNGSASVNASRDKLHSKFESVNEQTGIFAGKGGFDIKVGEHTQLDGAVIASTAEKEKNRLETGTLGFSDIDNQAEFKTEHQSAGFSTSGSMGSQIGQQLATNMASNMLGGTNKDKNQSSTTHAAVSDGTLILRDADKQQQDVATLSRDTENAANSLTPIFDKEKERQRLAQAQAIAEIGNQAMDIYNTQEAIAATKTATAAMKDPQRQQALKADAETQLRNENKEINAKTVAARAYDIAYDKALENQGAAIGGERRQAVTAVVTALQGLAGGDIKAAIASGAAPYLANAVKGLTYGYKTEYSQLTPEEKATHLLAHAILGGVIAEMKGGSATAGAMGAAGGELAASAIAGVLYSGKAIEELSPDEKEKVSNLSTLAGGIAAGLATNSTAGGVDGAQTAKNAVENNYLHVEQALEFDKEMQQCRVSGEDCQPIVDKWEKISNKQSEQLDANLKDKPLVAIEWDKERAYGGIQATERPQWVGDIFGLDVMRNEDAKAYVAYWNAIDIAKVDMNSPSWAKFATFAADPENQALLVGGGLLTKDLIKATTSYLSRNSASRAISASEIGMQWGQGNMKQGMPWEDYVGKALPTDARLPKNFKTFDYYDGATKTAISAKSMDTQTMAKLAKPNQIYSSIKGNIDAAAKFEKSALSGQQINSSMISHREIQLAVPANTTKTQWIEINRAIEYGKSQGVTVKVTQVK